MGVASFKHLSHLNTLYFTVFKKITKNNSLLGLVREHHLMGFIKNRKIRGHNYTIVQTPMFK